MLGSKRTAWLVIVLGFTSSTAGARIWHVELDGSGDYVVIQDAVDAASSGDEIQIGPGRFEEYSIVQDGGTYSVFVFIDKNLTLVGSGMGETVIGPDNITDFTWSDNVRGIRIRGNGLTVALRDLTIENILDRGVTFEDGRFEVDRCEIRHCAFRGLRGVFSQGGWVRDCHFHDNGHPGQTIALEFYQPSVGVDVTNCIFVNNLGASAGAWWPGCRDIDFHDCTFEGEEDGIVGVCFIDGASGSIRNCSISGQSNYGIWLSYCGTVVIEDNEITVPGEVLSAGMGIWYTSVDLTIRHNLVMSPGWVLEIPATVGNAMISENHFLRTSETAWWVYTNNYYPLGQPYYVNLENNYWGTTDTALLDQWIYDGNDNEDVDIFIEYLPLADGPVQTESTTWGAVKALFR